MQNTALKPKVEMYSPFKKPFSTKMEEDDKRIVSREIIEYMVSDNTKIVAKCTPCQCCACR